MNAIYSATLTTLAHLSKIAIGFILLKLIAVYLGVGGMGKVGHFMSAVTILSLMAGGGVVNGVIKYVAEYKSNTRRLLLFILAAKTYSVIFCTVFLIIGLVFDDSIAEYLFKSSSYYWVIDFLAFSQYGFAFTNLVTGTANGLSDTRTYAIIQICGNLLVLPLTWFLIRTYEIPGAALSIVLFYLLYSVPALFYYRKSRFWGKIDGFKIDSSNFKKLFSYSVMAMVGVVSVPLVEIFVREAVISDIGYDSAGIWQASIKLSSAYMGFFIVFLALYFMPMVSAQEDRTVIGIIVVRYLKIVMCLFVFGASTFYLLRCSLIPLLLSDNFTELETLIQFQLLGDFFRVSAYVIGFVVIAKAALKIYVFVEILQGVIFCGLSLLFINNGLGLKGVFIANLVMNAIYFFFSVLGFVTYLRRSERKYVDC